jgi:tight adherence protein C
MNAGLPEIKAYQDFGSRMPGEDYRRFCQLLIQLIRSGSRGMQEMMLQEAADAERKRRENAMRLGETAQTKLLLPMMMLLLVVLAVVMMPAFLTM